MLRATTACTFASSQFPKAVRTCSAFNMLTSKCASRHNGCIFLSSQLNLNFQKWSEHVVFLTCRPRNALRATTACTFSTSQLPKSGPNMVCFKRFDLEMCFTPQRRALFHHLNFQKWSEHVVLLTCRPQHVLRATTACTFSTSQLPKVVRTWCVLNMLTWKCASRHNGCTF